MDVSQERLKFGSLFLFAFTVDKCVQRGYIDTRPPGLVTDDVKQEIRKTRNSQSPRAETATRNRRTSVVRFRGSDFPKRLSAQVPYRARREDQMPPRFSIVTKSPRLAVKGLQECLFLVERKPSDIAVESDADGVSLDQLGSRARLNSVRQARRTGPLSPVTTIPSSPVMRERTRRGRRVRLRSVVRGTRAPRYSATCR